VLLCFSLGATRVSGHRLIRVTPGSRPETEEVPVMNHAVSVDRIGSTRGTETTRLT
jgi:hypothetical protein